MQCSLELPEGGLLEFPCEISIKAMGLACDEFELLVVELVRQHAPQLGENAVSSRLSSGGKYVSVSVRVQAQSREQMDAIYQALSDHQQVLMAL
jgi:putative lipoic acid-binding regulatory protein